LFPFNPMPSINMHQIIRFTALAVAIAVVGCGTKDEPSYANVSGTVTYDGKPLDKGQITFGIPGRPPSEADIVDGKYTGQAMVGKNRIQISAYRKSAKQKKLPTESAQKQMEAYQRLNKSGGGMKEGDRFDPSMEDYIPDDYGKESRQFRVVEAGGQNVF